MLCTVGTSCYLSFSVSLEHLNIIGNDLLFIQWWLSTNFSRSCHLSGGKVVTKSDFNISRVSNRIVYKDLPGPEGSKQLWSKNSLIIDDQRWEEISQV